MRRYFYLRIDDEYWCEGKGIPWRLGHWDKSKRKATKIPTNRLVIYMLDWSPHHHLIVERVE